MHAFFFFSEKNYKHIQNAHFFVKGFDITYCYSYKDERPKHKAVNEAFKKLLDLDNYPKVRAKWKFRVLGPRVNISDYQYEMLIELCRTIEIKYFKSKKVSYGIFQAFRQIVFKGKTDKVSVSSEEWDVKFDCLDLLKSCIDDIADYLIEKDGIYSEKTKLNADKRKLPEYRKIKESADDSCNDSSADHESSHHSSLDAAITPTIVIDASDSSEEENVCGL